ncbi:MAG: exodeoxyribonuclease VII large subunit [bacterium]
MDKQYLTVSAISKYIKYKFDNDVHLKNVYIEAEISNFKRNSRGHFYFTLKDSESQISATMFSNDASKVDFTPKDGQTVLVRGTISTYIPYGTYQINVNQITQKGLGDLYLAYEKLKKELEEKGYFDSSKKKSIPLYPKAIAVITSPTGAAVRDVINTIKRRYPIAQIYVYPSIVQGETAKTSIVKNIKLANEDGLVDTIIVGRGGGSIEDLWCFNEKVVAEAIFNSKVPIISAVGHETDFTISDFVADVRAATPTAAAEIATPDLSVLKNTINIYKTRIENSFHNKLNNIKQNLVNLDHRLDNSSPLIILEQLYNKKIQLDKLLGNNMINLLEFKHNKLRYNIEKLNALNPLSIMDKGFSLVKQEEKIIRSINDVNVDDKLSINLKDGKLNVKVVSKHE